MRLTILPLFDEANVVGIDPEEDDQAKLKYMTVVMASSRTFGKSTYAT